MTCLVMHSFLPHQHYSPSYNTQSTLILHSNGIYVQQNVQAMFCFCGEVQPIGSLLVQLLSNRRHANSQLQIPEHVSDQEMKLDKLYS